MKTLRVWVEEQCRCCCGNGKVPGWLFKKDCPKCYGRGKELERRERELSGYFPGGTFERDCPWCNKDKRWCDNPIVHKLDLFYAQFVSSPTEPGQTTKESQ